MLRKGFATPKGTAAYSRRIRCAYGHFRTVQGLSLSSIGQGTYMGESTPEADASYVEAIACAFQMGVNVFDTSIGYREQRSERAIASALDANQREEFLVATKAELPDDPALTAPFLEDQLERSRLNLNLETIDILYLQNPEMKLAKTNTTGLFALMRPAIKFLEAQVAAGRIRWYGAATWQGLRLQADAKDYLSLEMFPLLAQEVGGVEHHFRFLQLPMNLGMGEGFFHHNQWVNNGPSSVIAGAAHFGINVIACASLMQGQLLGRIPPSIQRAFRELKTDASIALQFARSIPGVTTALVGMGNVKHAQENLRMASIPPMPKDRFLSIFQPK